MTDAEIDRIISDIDQLARRIGQRFIPDPDKLAAFREAQKRAREYRVEYDKCIKELQNLKG